ncbi:MAG: DUF393 domain-containing protein [Rhodospirillales bacterium]
MRTNTMEEPATTELSVYYDGACPICRREIDFYRGRDREGSVDWIDVADGASALPPGLDRETALQRIHVRSLDGEWITGGRAFAEIWSAIPGIQAFGRVCRLPPFPWILDFAYEAFLKLRPMIRRILT